MTDRDPLDTHFIEAISALTAGAPRDPALPVREGTALTGRAARQLFEAQAASRHLDFAARLLRASGAGFYTIGSSGHESNAAVAAALRHTDPALLHYRSGGFYLARAQQVPGHDAIHDVLLGLVGSAQEPIAGGRHKVFGHHGLAVIPQTSTIGSHVPRAMGTAFAIERARKLGVDSPWPRDAVAVCSFGDASANHSTTVGAINTTSWTAYQGLPLPLLLVCEDNGIGISVRTPSGWIKANYGDRPGLRYFSADGTDPAAVYDAACEAVSWVRRRRLPVFLHLLTVRFGGHAGSDVESSYRSGAEVVAEYARDPLLGTARQLIEAGIMTPAEVLASYEAARDRVLSTAEQVSSGAVRLSSAAEVMAPLAAHRPDAVRKLATLAAPDRARMFLGGLPEDEGSLTLALSINRTLLDAGARHPGLLVFGEDVARKGGVYGVTRGLQRRLGSARVFDTLLDEQSILGLALGSAISGLLPVPEIQYLAYLHNAEDQLRGEAATLSFFSQGQYRNPLVVRVAGLGYQKGFGGHFHNENSIGVLRDIPGLIIACPSHPADAAPMLRTCLAAAVADGRVSVFLEPIALYHTRDLHEPGDEQWLAPYAGPAQWPNVHVPVGRARTHGDGTDLTIITFGNGLYLSQRVARRLREDWISARVVDLRWLAPMPVEDICAAAQATGRVLIVDETRRTGGISEAIVTALIEDGFTGPITRVSSADSFIPLGDAANLVLVDEVQIEQAARELVRASRVS